MFITKKVYYKAMFSKKIIFMVSLIIIVSNRIVKTKVLLHLVTCRKKKEYQQIYFKLIITLKLGYNKAYFCKSSNLIFFNLIEVY